MKVRTDLTSLFTSVASVEFLLRVPLHGSSGGRPKCVWFLRAL